MIVAPTYKDKKVGVFGLARTGLAAVDALVASGAQVAAWDDNKKGVDALSITGTDLYEADFRDFDALMLAPGVPLTHPEPHKLVKKARAANLKIISDFDVFEAARPSLKQNQCIAITGTNGKSTTTALIEHMINASGRPSLMGGNIGTGVLALNPLPEGGVYVFEMSSFQLDITHDLRPDIAIFLNISPDHLDRHGDMAGYARAKGRIFDLQKGEGVAIVGIDEPEGLSLFEMHKENAVAVSVGNKLDCGISVLDGRLYDTRVSLDPLMDISDCQALSGPHNWQNAAAAYGAGRALGLDTMSILEAFKSFPGLAHRQEIVRTLEGVRYVNDSKATNVDAAARALDTFSNIHWIAGGRPKGAVDPEIKDHMGGVKRAYLIGESADEIAGLISDQTEIELSGTMDQAVASAHRYAKEGDTVLLSPACTAFDQFTSFIERGDTFRECVLRLPVSSQKG